MSVRDLVVQPTGPDLDCRVIFSALPTDTARTVEQRFAQKGYAVCTNASPHRLDPDVPLLVPEVNADHTKLIESQRRLRNWPGLIVASANCTTTQLVLPLKALDAAFGIRKLFIVTLQSITGAGYPGVPSADILGNIVPFISGEEEKVEQESRKLLGTLRGEDIVAAPFGVSAHCNRVPVYYGHTECVSVEFEHQPKPNDVINVLDEFTGPPEAAQLPSTPQQPIVVFREQDRPQPLLDSLVGDGMSVSVGRVRPCPLFDTRFVILGHNTVRGAAGGAIHNAELLVAQKWL
jgi:aspartate-semialdehyde dehydrogenase